MTEIEKTNIKELVNIIGNAELSNKCHSDCFINTDFDNECSLCRSATALWKAGYRKQSEEEINKIIITAKRKLYDANLESVNQIMGEREKDIKQAWQNGYNKARKEVLKEFAEYEDTGLSPTEVEALKHRADVAEEALRNGAVGEDLYCSSDDERHRLYLHLIREAEERLKENK